MISGGGYYPYQIVGDYPYDYNRLGCPCRQGMGGGGGPNVVVEHRVADDGRLSAIGDGLLRVFNSRAQ